MYWSHSVGNLNYESERKQGLPGKRTDNRLHEQYRTPVNQSPSKGYSCSTTSYNIFNFLRAKRHTKVKHVSATGAGLRLHGVPRSKCSCPRYSASPLQSTASTRQARVHQRDHITFIRWVFLKYMAYSVPSPPLRHWCFLLTPSSPGIVVLFGIICCHLSLRIRLRHLIWKM